MPLNCFGFHLSVENCKESGPLVYKLALLRELFLIYDVFHVSLLRQYRSNPNYVIHELQIEIFEGLTYEVEPIGILDRKMKWLRNKEIPIVKVKWSRHALKK